MGLRGPKKGQGGRPSARQRAASGTARLSQFFASRHARGMEQNPGPGAVVDDNQNEAGDQIGEELATTSDGSSDCSDDNEATDVEDDSESWPAATLNWFVHLKEEVDAAIEIRENRIRGNFPTHLRGKIQPQSDPVAFFGTSKIVLEMSDFCLPDCLIWYPEAQWPALYPHCRPKCKWHDSFDCVRHHGWVRSPRHCYDLPRLTALMGKKYFCIERKRLEGVSHYFRGYDPEVLEKAPDYVRTIWLKIGYTLSHRGGVSNQVVSNLRTSLSQGLSSSGYQSGLMEQLKHEHFLTSVMWRSYVDGIRMNPPLFATPAIIQESMVDFVEFDSTEYQGRVPSLSYLLTLVVQQIESDMNYHQRRMQMVDGKHLSGDHSFKLAKMVSTREGKVFTAMYTIMNEFGQVVAWWFTTGTSLSEIEEAVLKLRLRYDLQGFDEPQSVTTDRCCQERNFWNRTMRLRFSEENMREAYEGSDIMEKEVIRLPLPPKYACTFDVAGTFAGEIASFLRTQDHEKQVVGLDCEWDLGNTKADVLQLCTSDGQVYLFHLSRIKRIHPVLLSMLGNPGVKKAGNRIHNDVKKMLGWKVTVKGDAELGHLAAARCLSGRAPSLKSLVELLFDGVELEGKDQTSGGAVRVSKWSSTHLTENQIEYAAKDAYATMWVYKKLMTIMDPRVEGKIRPEEVDPGRAVTLYQRGWKTRVAIGTIARWLDKANRRSVVVRVNIFPDDENRIYALGTIVQRDSGAVEDTIVLQALVEEAMANDDDHVLFTWPLYLLRRVLGESTEDEVCLATERKQIVRTEDDLPYSYARQPSRGEGESSTDSADSDSDGEDDNRTELPRNLRRRLFKFCNDKVKQDIAHIFFRFERTLTKTHGAYDSFITALRDAMYMVNPDDLLECKRVLKEEIGLDEEAIERKIAFEFGWFLQRCRRHVPPPDTLLKRYMAVYTEFKDAKCAKSGRELFGHPKAAKLHKSVVKHIRRNCVSDIPFVSYYITAGEDSNGLPLYRCIRGTSALEGLHQKLRQLVRGFNNSPRLVRALLSDYLFRWNHNIDVDLRQLDKEYSGFYDGPNLEREIERMACWPNRLSPPHESWLSTRGVMDTGESFGVIGEQLPVAADFGSSEELTALTGEVAQQLHDDETTQQYECRVDGSMSCSSCWLATVTGKFRPIGRVRGKEQWEYFVGEYPRFQGVPDDADNYTSINFSAFAKSWNQYLDEVVAMDPETSTGITYKTAALLKEAYKMHKQRSVVAATLLPLERNLEALTNELRQPAGEHEVEFPDAEQPEPPMVMVDSVSTVHVDVSTQTAPPTEGDQQHEDEVFYDTVSATAATRRSYSMPRCRMCGHPYRDPRWLEHHSVPMPLEEVYSGTKCRNLLNQKGLEPWRFCTVPPEQRVSDQFPVPQGKRMPRPKKKFRQSNEPP